MSGHHQEGDTVDEISQPRQEDDMAENIPEPQQEGDVVEEPSEPQLEEDSTDETPEPQQEEDVAEERSEARQEEYNVEAWTDEQLEIAKNVNYNDENEWSSHFTENGFEGERDLLIAGADISFSTTTPGFSVGTLTVVQLRTDQSTELVFSRSLQVEVSFPYVPSFLGFRESVVVSTLLSKIPEKVREKIDCLLLDGNGVLHPRKAGLACHVGVAQNIPTIGVAKSLLCVDGLDEKEVQRQVAEAKGDSIEVVGESKFVWARAILTGNARTKPIYVSVGHKVSLITAARLVKSLCKYRIPSPIRFADMHSRAFLRGEPIEVYEIEAFL